MPENVCDEHEDDDCETAGEISRAENIKGKYIPRKEEKEDAIGGELVMMIIAMNCSNRQVLVGHK